jgi:hypothetical protein
METTDPVSTVITIPSNDASKISYAAVAARQPSPTSTPNQTQHAPMDINLSPIEFPPAQRQTNKRKRKLPTVTKPSKTNYKKKLITLDATATVSPATLCQDLRMPEDFNDQVLDARRIRTVSPSPAPSIDPAALPTSCPDVNATIPDISLLPNLTQPSFQIPNPVVEQDLNRLDDMPTDLTPCDMPELSYTIVHDATKRSKPRLVDSHNHVYNQKTVLRKTGHTVWQCSVWNKDIYCTATVKQLEDSFTAGPTSHICTPKSSALPASQVRSQIIKDAKDQPFTSSSTLVNNALQQHLEPSAPTESLPKHASLVRMANKRRQGSRPANPTTLDFDLQENAIPDNFMQGDLHVGNKRHFIFFTATLLSLLRVSKEWYVDATFKVVGAPFTQLWSIHAFLKNGDSLKQVPLIFSLMSGKSIGDYVCVLQHVLHKLQPSQSVVSVVLDFEAALWSAIRETMPNVQLRGCHFHWTQAIWRKVQDLGLAAPYQRDAKTQKFIRRLFCLPFLPPQHIQPVFNSILALDTPATPMPIPLRQLLDYINATWIQSTLWPPACWSVFNRSIRTNNDVEGYHRRLNTKTHRHNLPFYQLVELLHSESKFVDIQAQFISDDKLKRDQRQHFKQQQAKMFSMWDDFSSDKLDSLDLLREISKVYKPVTRV